MGQITSVTLPIFLVIALGYACVRVNYISRANVATLGQFVLKVTVPSLVFSTLTEATDSAVVSLSYILPYAAGSLLSFAAVLALTRTLGNERPLGALQALGSSVSNSAYIAYPIASMVLGSVAGTFLVQNMLVENAVMLSLGLAVAESASAGGRRWQQVVTGSLARVARNPIIVAIAAGIVASMLEWHLPAPVSGAVELLSRAAAPIALFVVGGSLAGLRLYGMMTDVAIVTAAKLLLHPLLVVACLLAFPGGTREELAAGMIFSAVPMLSIFPLFGERYGRREFCSAALLTATASSFVTLSLVLLVIRYWIGIAY